MSYCYFGEIFLTYRSGPRRTIAGIGGQEFHQNCWTCFEYGIHFVLEAVGFWMMKNSLTLTFHNFAHFQKLRHYFYGDNFFNDVARELSIDQSKRSNLDSLAPGEVITMPCCISFSNRCIHCPITFKGIASSSGTKGLITGCFLRKIGTGQPETRFVTCQWS